MSTISGHVYAAVVASLMFSAGFAEARQADVAVGYLKLAGTMQGVSFQPSWQASEHWGLVGEFAATRGKDCADCDVEFRDLAGLGGVRFRWQPTKRVAPFVQVLAGGLHSSAGEYFTEYCCGIGRRLEPGYTISYLAVQPGGGVTVMANDRFGFRAQTDLQFAIPDQSQWEGISIFPRVMLGGVVRLGR